MPVATESATNRAAVPAAGHAPALSVVGPVARVASVDAFRGFVMFLMMAEVLKFSEVAKALPGNGFWAFLASQQTHVPWVGCTLHDLIQPSFSFLVGVALPYSLASRAAQGQSQTRRTLHAFWRAFVLVLLGVFLRSTHSNGTNWTFEDTLTQIGLGYGFLYLLGLASVRVQVAALFAILIGYWALFALYPLPGPAFDWASTGTTADAAERLTGFAAHWNLNTNPAWAFDQWFLNLFPRETPFTNNGGGYATLSFIPTLATMILGLLAGQLLRTSRNPGQKLCWLLLAGTIGLVAGWGLNASGICPVVKRIWTPSWVLFSGGWAFIILAFLYAVIDVGRLRGWAFAFIVIGMNSIAAYLIAHLFVSFIRAALPRHLGSAAFHGFGDAYTPFLLGAATLLVEWLLLLWMYRRKIFLRI
ncbi:MAG TPA: DUF5009 domain-containing protein [Pirellulales bacterium]|jgi:predicted acyltransferase|nr:DUF5009 domain-containing protein [Pirellulales bacterium]